MIPYATISDLHMGHRKNPSEFIYKNTTTWLDKLDIVYPQGIQYLFIAGDLTDTLLDMASEDSIYLIKLMDYILNYCAKRKIRLRVLEGTPSHDWKQMRLLKQLITMGKNQGHLRELDAKYIEILSIEITDDMSILYVPDEWTSSTSKTLEQVKALLKENNLAQVDTAIMHGQFGYQLPDFLDDELSHNEVEYLKIVKHFINIGHVHVYNPFDRIIPQGSLDRLAYNEEGPKGGTICEIKGKKDTHIFIENENAMIFKDIVLTDVAIDDIWDTIDKTIEGLPLTSHFRIVANSDHPSIIGFRELCSKYPQYNLDKKIIKDKTPTEKINLRKAIDFTPTTITRENIMTQLLAECDFDDVDEELAKTILTKHW